MGENRQTGREESHMSQEKEEIAPVQQEDRQDIPRSYVLRDLRDCDLFPMLQILKKIGVGEFKDAFFGMASGQKEEKEAGLGVALNLADILIGNIGRVEDDIYELWADLSGIGGKELREMEFGTLPLMIYDTFQKARNTSFFKVLSKLLQ